MSADPSSFGAADKAKWQAQQERTFVGWANFHLSRAGLPVATRFPDGLLIFAAESSREFERVGELERETESWREFESSRVREFERESVCVSMTVPGESRL
jgi:hypothetical protein